LTGIFVIAPDLQLFGRQCQRKFPCKLLRGMKILQSARSQKMARRKIWRIGKWAGLGGLYSGEACFPVRHQAGRSMGFLPLSDLDCRRRSGSSSRAVASPC